MSEHLPAPRNDGNQFVTMMQQALSANVTPEAFEMLVRLYREEQDRVAVRAYAQALNAVQAELESVKRAKLNPAFNSRYAPLEAVDAELRPIYTQHGFSVQFQTADPQRDPGNVRAGITIFHREGHSCTFWQEAPPDKASSGGRATKTDLHALGSTMSYLHRYLLQYGFAVVTAGLDDDGEGQRRAPSPLPGRVAYPPPQTPSRRKPAASPAQWFNETFEEIGKETDEMGRVGVLIKRISQFSLEQMQALARNGEWIARCRQMPDDTGRCLEDALRETIEKHPDNIPPDDIPPAEEAAE